MMNDEVTVTCDCGKRVRVPFSGLGKRAKCPHCGNIFVPSEQIKRTGNVEAATHRPSSGSTLNASSLPAFICPNPKCNFQGQCSQAEVTRGYWVAGITLLVGGGVFGLCFFAVVREIISGRLPLAISLVIVAGLILGGVALLAALVVFITRVTIAATPRWYCPNCGTRLR